MLDEEPKADDGKPAISLESLQEKGSIVFKDLDGLGLEKIATGCTLKTVLIEKMMAHWPNSKQIRVIDEAGDTRSVFFYPDDPSPYFSYDDDLKEGNIVTFTAPRIHYFMDGQLGLRIEDASIVGVTHVNNFDKRKKLDFAEAEKTSGTNHFKDGKFEKAIDRYASAIRHADAVSQTDYPQDQDRRNQLLQACFLNLAACFIQEKKYEQAIANCQRANEVSPSAKAYFRTGQAYEKLKDEPRALDSYSKALELSPDDPLIKKAVKTLTAEAKARRDAEAKLWSGVLKKGA